MGTAPRALVHLELAIGMTLKPIFDIAHLGIVGDLKSIEAGE